MKKHKMIYVKWVDSSLQPSWVKAPSEDTGTVKIETIGYLILEDKKHIEVTQSKTSIHKSAIMSIPKVVILKRKELRIKK